jgi:peptidoglycan lytic transglycosylase
LRNRKRKSGRFIKFIFLLFIAMGGWGLYQWRHSVRDMLMMGSEDAYDKYIYAAAEKHNVEPALIKAVINQETRFQPNLRGAAGEVGLMQIIPSKAVTDWAVAHNVEVPCDGILFRPQANIDIGTWYLKQGLKRWCKYKYYRELALCQYNAGGSWARKWAPEKVDEPFMEKISIGSTKRYVKRVMEKYRNYTTENIGKSVKQQ